MSLAQAFPKPIPASFPTYPTKHKRYFIALKPKNNFYPVCTGLTIMMIRFDEEINKTEVGEDK